MAGMTDSQQAIYDGLRTENWSISGPRRIVKVKRLDAAIDEADGFITVESYLSRRTPAQINQMLGLPPAYLSDGCNVYAFLRLPKAGEYEYELTAQYPNGLACNDADVAEGLSDYQLNKRAGDPTKKVAYPAGSRWVHQWRLKEKIPVQRIAVLLPGQAYKVDWNKH